jgi:hypothetical protein
MVSRPEIDQSFYQHLIAEDELGVVVRAHIHIEASLTEFVEARTPFPEHLPRLTYEARLRLACALGLKRDHFDALKILGDIRNSFGHRIDAKLTDPKINELFSKLPPDTRQLTLQAYDMTNAKREVKGPPKLLDLPPKDRFVLIAVMLQSFITVAALEAKRGRNGT